MDRTSTLQELVEFTKNEKAILESLGLVQREEKPSGSVVNSILNYSKSLSVRDNAYIGQVEMVLN